MQNAAALEAKVRSEYEGRLPPAPHPGQYVLVLGPTSSGKSTTIKAFVESHSCWRRVYDESLLAPGRFRRYLEGTATSPVDYLPFELEALLVRFLQNLNCGERTIADQGVLSIWAYARAVHAIGGLSDDHYQSIVSLALTLDHLTPRPAMSIRFTCNAAVARSRLERRGREHELKLCTVEFLDGLNSAYEAVVEMLKPSPVYLIDSSNKSEREVLAIFESLVLPEAR